MKTFVTTILGLLALLILAGCEPEKLILWSPSGSVAVVAGEDGIYLCDAKGKLSKLLIPLSKPGAWIDEKHLVVKETIHVQTWADASKYLTDEQKTIVEKTSPQVIVKALAYTGPREKLAEAIIADVGDNAHLLEGMLLFIRETAAAQLAARFAEDWVNIQNAAISINVLRVYEIDFDRATPGKMLAGTFAAIYDVNLSANRTAVAFTSGERTSGGGRMSSLFVVPADASRTATRVSDMVGRHIDFSHDGHLVYFRANLPRGESGDALRLGSIRRIKMTDEKGNLLSDIPIDEEKTVVNPDGQQKTQPSPAQVVALVLYSEFNRIHCLSDGRILFSGTQLRIPATNSQMPQRSTLFVVAQPGEGTVEPLFDPAKQMQLADIVEAFEVSPDEKRISVPGTGNHLVVVDLATGAITTVNPKEQDQQVKVQPVWRSDDELCYAIVNKKEDERSGDLLLWSVTSKQSTWLSNGWPDAVVKPLRSDDQ